MSERAAVICACGDHAWVSIGRGLVTLVSREDERLLAAYAWKPLLRRRKNRVEVYVGRSVGRQKSETLHSRVLERPSGKIIDHKNRNTLDNRRVNLRLCTHQQNTFNRISIKSGASRYKGVTPYRRRSGWWVANIKLNNRTLHLGVFEDEQTAAAAYDKAASKYFGEFALTNHDLGLV